MRKAGLVSVAAISSARWVSLGGIVRITLQLLQLGLLARLLSPDAYGLMAVASMTHIVVLAIGELGLSSALIHCKTSSSSQRGTLFWLTAAVTLASVITFSFLSPLIASLADDARFGSMVMFGSAIGFCAVLGAQPRALAEKKLAFRQVVLIELSAQALGMLVAVIAALLSFGVMALVLSALIMQAMASLLFWIILADEWPSAPSFDVEEISEFLAFGRSLTLSRLVNFFAANVDLMAATVFFTSTQLGQFSVPRAVSLQIQGVVTPIVTRVGFPVISSVNQSRSEVQSVYGTILDATASINAPVYASLFFFSHEVTAILLGPQWTESAVLFELLAIWGLLRSISSPVGSLLLGTGRPDLALRCDISVAALMVVVSLLTVIYGPEALARGMVLAMAMVILPIWYCLVCPRSGIGLKLYLKATILPSALAFSAGFIVRSIVPLPVAHVSGLVVGVLALFFLYTVLTTIMNRPAIKMLKKLWPEFE